MTIFRVYSFLKILFFILIAHGLLTRKRSLTYCIIAFLLNTVFVFSSCIYFSHNLNNEAIIKALTYCISFSYLVYFHLVFEESAAKKIFTFFSICMFSTIGLLIATPCAKLISNIIHVDYFQNIVYLHRIIINFLFVLASFFWIGKDYKAILNLVSDKTIKYMASYPIIAFLLLITNFTTPTEISNVRNFNSIYSMLLFLLLIIVGYILVFVSISSASQIVSLQYHMEKLELISNTDALTGIYNRRYITEKLDTEKHFSIILADIDYFKKINDSFGHICGDKVLKVVSQSLKDIVGNNGYVSRWGGEEFLILLPEAKTDDALILADKMRTFNEVNVIAYNQATISVTLTFGIAVKKDGEMVKDIIKRADTALYQGKNQGRNCVILSDS